MKISNPFYSFYAIFFALAMLNAPPSKKTSTATDTKPKPTLLLRLPSQNRWRTQSHITLPVSNALKTV